MEGIEQPQQPQANRPTNRSARRRHQRRMARQREERRQQLVNAQRREARVGRKCRCLGWKCILDDQRDDPGRGRCVYQRIFVHSWYEYFRTTNRESWNQLTHTILVELMKHCVSITHDLRQDWLQDFPNLPPLREVTMVELVSLQCQFLASAREYGARFVPGLTYPRVIPFHLYNTEQPPNEPIPDSTSEDSGDRSAAEDELERQFGDPLPEVIEDGDPDLQFGPAPLVAYADDMIIARNNNHG